MLVWWSSVTTVVFHWRMILVCHMATELSLTLVTGFGLVNVTQLALKEGGQIDLQGRVTITRVGL